MKNKNKYQMKYFIVENCAKKATKTIRRRWKERRQNANRILKEYQKDVPCSDFQFISGCTRFSAAQNHFHCKMGHIIILCTTCWQFNLQFELINFFVYEFYFFFFRFSLRWMGLLLLLLVLTVDTTKDEINTDFSCLFRLSISSIH